MHAWKWRTDTWQQCLLLQCGHCCKIWMWAGLSEILSYRSVLAIRASHIRWWVNLLIFMLWSSCLLGWLELKLYLPCLSGLLENFWYVTHRMSNFLYFQILMDAFLNLRVLWNMEELWTSATCSTWGKLKKPSFSAWKIVKFGLPCMME